MGTSASSNGPGAGVSFDPPWLDDIDIPNSDKENNHVNMGDNEIVAPKARFREARRNMGDYIRSGNKDSLRRALGHYSKNGMAGAKNVSQRMRTSTKVAANLFNTLQSIRDHKSYQLGHIISELREKGANASEIIDEIVTSVCPNGGSIDEVTCKDSGEIALSEFMELYPDADINNLTDDQIWSLVGKFLSNEIFDRIQLDIGQAFENQDIPYVDRINRMNEMKEFIESELATQLNTMRSDANSTIEVEILLEKTIENTFKVYEVEV